MVQNATRFSITAAGRPSHVMGRLGASLVAATLLLTMPGIGAQAALGTAASTTATNVGHHDLDVAKTATSTTVVSDTSPSVYRQPVTFTATVTGPSVTYNTGAGIFGPRGIAAGPDGALWFTNQGTNSIGRISTTDVVTNYTDPSINWPLGIAGALDGALWFTNQGTDSIGRIDATTHAVTNYTDASISAPLGIATGSDLALWFTNSGNNSIGRIDATTYAVTDYTDPSTTIIAPDGIAAGSDGALWFTNGNNSIGRIDATTHAVTNYTGTGISNPVGITSGPDGALWFTNYGNNSIGRIDATTHAVTNYPDPSISGPAGITSGPDGALWFTSNSNNSIGRISTAGTVTNHTDPSISSPFGIAAGADGALWFTNYGSESIGRIEQVGVTSGTVQFKVDGVNLGSPATVSGGEAQLVTTSLAVKASPGHAIIAVYSGDASYNGSTSAVLHQIVTKAATATSLTSNANPAHKKTPIHFTATVAVVLPGAGTPTGTVIFKINGVKVGSAIVRPNGTATFTISEPKGTYKVTATYKGDAHFVSNTSPIYTQRVIA